MGQTLIIGAGTAGLSCGRILDELRKDYLIVDQKKEVGKPYRSTYGVSMFYVNRYGMPGHDGMDGGVIASYIDSIRLETDESHYDLDFGKHVGLVYDPAKYEPQMATGLNINLNTRVQWIGNGEVLLSDGDRMKPDNVIVAAGPTTNLLPTSKEFAYDRKEWVAAYEESRYLPKRSDVDLVLHFSDRYAPGGYLWDFPSNNGMRRIGIGVKQSMGTRPVDMLHAYDELRPEWKGSVDHTISHVIPLCHPPKQVVFGNTAYIGESARTTFASTGGGLQSAFRSGMLAGISIAVDGNLKGYQKAWNRELYPMLKRHYKIKKTMYGVGQKGFNDLLEVASGFHIKSEDVIAEMPRLAKYLMLRKPSLLFRMIGLLL